jgi:hypothetical protein
MKTILPVLLLSVCVLAKAQNEAPDRLSWFDLHIAQTFGLNDWNRVRFASDRLPRAVSSTELRMGISIYAIRPIGVFADMGVAIMPATRNGFSDPSEQASFYTGAPCYAREMTVEEGYQSASGHFKMTFGVFGEIQYRERLTIIPRLGIGLMTVAAPTCEAVLKEQGTNMQYLARYQWFGQNENDGGGASLGYLACRLQCALKVSPKLNLLFGAEYNWFYTRADFSETYTNYFNRNNVTTKYYEGNRLHTAGLSLGLSF